MSQQEHTPQEKQEPTAWRWRHKGANALAWKYDTHKPEGPSIHLYEVQPLYAEPQGDGSIWIGSLVERLEGTARGLRRSVENAKFGGDATYVRVKSPELLLADLDQAAATITSLTEVKDALLRLLAVGILNPTGSASVADAVAAARKAISKAA